MSRRAALLVPLLALVACASPVEESTGESSDELAAHSKVESWITSDPSRPFERRPNGSFGTPPAAANGAGVVDVDDAPANLRQEVLGFGAALTDASAAIMERELGRNARDALLEELMSPNKGLGLSVLRLPMAASDSTWDGAYSYDDGAPDPDLSRFSVRHDDAYIVPQLQHVLEHVNPGLKIIATPWSPPAWMKQGTGSMIGGTLRSEYRQAWAEYFVKFVRAYWQRHIPIYAVTPQNEPGQPANYPSMTLPPAEEAELVPVLSAALDRAHFGWVKILGFDHNWGDSYPGDLLSHANAASKLDGIAFHCYGGDHSSALSTLHAQHPKKDLYVTECDRSETPRGQNAGHGEGIQKLIRAMNNWSRTYLAWQLVLHPDGTPNQGSGCMHEDASGRVIWHCVGVVSVDPHSHAVTKEWDYAYLGHASKFVARGARVVRLEPVRSVESVAFVNPNGSRVLVAYNASENEQRLRIRWHGASFDAAIPKRAAATFRW